MLSVAIQHCDWLSVGTMHAASVACPFTKLMMTQILVNVCPASHHETWTHLRGHRNLLGSLRCGRKGSRDRSGNTSDGKLHNATGFNHIVDIRAQSIRA